MSVFLDACNGIPTNYTPIWLNRQAGRYMPEYHLLKGNMPSLAFFKNPELAARATLDAQRILGVDAAIVFADLLPVLEPMGFDLDYEPGVGPVIHNPIRDAHAVEQCRVIPATEGTPYISETIEQIKSDLPTDIALIGFAGAPFTLAAYAIEGGGSKQFAMIKRFMYEEPIAWHMLMSKLVDVLADYANLQIKAGVDAMQIFDSWVGCLSQEDYAEYVQPATEQLMHRIKGKVPVIYFGTGNSHLIDAMYSTCPDLLALDWRTPLVPTWERLRCKSIQGNMDPIALCVDEATVVKHATQLLNAVGGRPGHIFNLGHGIVPQTPVDNVKRLVDFVHEYSAKEFNRSRGTCQ